MGIFTYLFNFIETFLHSRKRSSCPEVFYKKSVLRNFAKFIGKHLCQSLELYLKRDSGRNFMKKENLAQMVSCEFCGISKKTFYYRTPLVAASDSFRSYILSKQNSVKELRNYNRKLFLCPTNI